MKFSSGDIEKIARLARIMLTDEEKERFGAELSAIAGYVEQLNEIDTEGVTPMIGGTRLETVMRRDAPESDLLEGDSGLLLKAAPVLKDGWFKVKAVFEE